jgi:hypothetical protein
MNKSVEKRNMKRQYIAPETWITPYEAIDILAYSRFGYAIDNKPPNDNNIINIEEEDENWPGEGQWGDTWSGEDWTDTGFYLDLD